MIKLIKHSADENSSIGYILEVDHVCLDELYKLHDVHPLAPENLKINYNMLSIVQITLT